MVTLGLMALLVIVCSVVAVGVAYLTRPIAVNLDIALIQTPVDLDAVLFRQLGRVPSVSLAYVGPGSYQIRSRYLPYWAVVAMVVTFPLGLLFLLVRSHFVLHLVLTPGGTLRCTGRTRASTWGQISRLLGPMVRSAPAEVSTAR